MFSCLLRFTLVCMLLARGANCCVLFFFGRRDEDGSEMGQLLSTHRQKLSQLQFRIQKFLIVTSPKSRWGWHSWLNSSRIVVKFWIFHQLEESFHHTNSKLYWHRLICNQPQMTPIAFNFYLRSFIKLLYFLELREKHQREWWKENRWVGISMKQDVILSINQFSAFSCDFCEYFSIDLYKCR